LQRRLDQALAERDEALDQQTATTEVLQVINSSRGDPAPVFDAILENAHTLCGADRGALVTFDGEWFRAIATRGMPEHFAEFMRSGFPLFSGSPMEPLVYGDPFLHIPDLAAFAAGSAPEVARAVSPALEIAGTRTILMVSLRKDGQVLGSETTQTMPARLDCRILATVLTSPACWYARARGTELMEPWGPDDLTSGQVGLYWFGASVGL
jgi:hypothetical protein